MQRVLKKIDTDGDGAIDQDEFLAAVVSLRELVASEHDALKKTHQEETRQSVAALMENRSQLEASRKSLADL